ncbi:MAG: polyketide synthase dehydratase domain-containing protein, partial [Candidatus Omnitrophica bacterium]|nr:polyketide synthase dehydratase domain-containing protein [Candidatus Omnitrophota bacterium]
MLSSLAALWVSGGSIRWNGWDPQADHARASLPTYPFQRERCWIQIEKKEQPDQPGGRAGAYPLPVRRIVSPALEKAVFECSFGADSLKFLADHRIFGLQLLPSPAYLEMALAAADSITPGLHVIENFTIFAGLSIPEAGERIVQLILEPEISARAGFTFYSQDPASGKWTRNAAGTLLVGRHQEVARSLFNAAPVRQRCTEHISGTEYYQSIEKLGLEFGPMFQGLADIWRRDGEALGEMRLPEALNAELEHYHFHPAFLDAC